jgi:AMMECR1 domain-containing protein
MFPAIKLNEHSGAMAVALALAAMVVFAPRLQAAVAEHELTLPQVVRLVEAVHFGEQSTGNQTLSEFVSSLPVSKRFRKPAGVFVTLSIHGKTRACWGSIAGEESSILDATASATIGALTREYRFPPVASNEWKRLKAQVTVIRAVEPIASFRELNPWHDGLLVRSGGKAGVLLPGEAADAYYEVVQCKLKAGIRPNESCQLYRLRSEIYE